jgi:hypothetical protein
MANANAPCGFIPIRDKTGGTTFEISPYSIASGYNTAIGMGDPVQLTGTGKNIELSEATNVDNIGIFAGVQYNNAQGNPVWVEQWAAGTTGTDIIAFVYDSPLLVYEAQMDTCAEANIGTVCDWVIGAPTAAHPRSQTYLTAGSATTGGSVRILGLINRPDNAYGAYAKVECMLAEHVLLTGTNSAGGV